MNDINLKEKLLNQSKYFNMKAICELAGVNYQTFRGWKNNGYSMSDEKLKKILDAMKKICD